MKQASVALTATIDALPDEADLNDKIATYQLRAEEEGRKNRKETKPKGELSEEIIRLPKNVKKSPMKILKIRPKPRLMH